MRVLAIECSTEWLAVALGDASGARERHEPAAQAHSQRVLPLVGELLADAGWSLADLDGVAFGAGPGSFTGVRIACGVAQGLALGAELPVIGVDTLEALAEEAFARHGAQRIVSCIDARMREVYLAAYERAGNGWREVLPPQVTRPSDAAVPQPGWFGAGNGFAAYPALGEQLALATVDAALRPSAAAVIRLAAPRLAAGDGVAPENALPRYVRHRVALTSAERAAGLSL